MLFLAALFFASSLAAYQTTAVYSGGDCGGDAIVWLTLRTSTACLEVACAGIADYSSEILCSDDVPDIPGGLAGWTEYDAADCQGNAVAVYGYTTGCVGYSSLSYQTECVDGGLTYTSYTNGDCSGSGQGSAVYESGCISAGGRSILQSSCENGGSDVSVDWKAYLRAYLSEVGQGWVIPTFSTTSFYSNHGTWQNGESSTSVVISFTGTIDSDQIDIFVSAVCSDIRENADGGVCNEAEVGECLSNPNPVSISCTWTVETAKRQGDASAINFNAQMSSGVALTGFFALCISLMVLLF
jgi:hypothetical protein